jgi:hypothetical protein
MFERAAGGHCVVGARPGGIFRILTYFGLRNLAYMTCRNIYDMVLEMMEQILREELLKILKKSTKTNKNDKQLLKLMDKIKKQKRLKSQEFLNIHSMLWKAGPATLYRSPQKWERVTRDIHFSKP